METKCPKRRAPNFSEEEKQILLICVKKEASVLNNKKTDSSSVYHKKLAWERIEKNFNSYECVVRRDVLMLKRFWESIKVKVRRESRQSRVELSKSSDEALSPEAEESYDISLTDPPLKVEWANETNDSPMAATRENDGSMTDNSLLCMQEVQYNDEETIKDLPPSFTSHLRRSGSKKPVDKEQDLLSTEAAARITALKQSSDQREVLQDLMIQKHKVQMQIAEAAERREIELYQLKKRALELEIEERTASLQLSKIRLAQEKEHR